MGQKSVIRSGVINVRAHPNSPEVYRKLIRQAYKLKVANKLRGDRYAVISLLQKDLVDDKFVQGVLTTFTRIDERSDWFDLENLEEASGEKVAQISIPENLFPNPKSFYFLFNIQTHRLHLQTWSRRDTISVRDATKMFSRLFSNPKISSKFGDVKVTMVQSSQSLERIFSIKRISKVTIKIERPNADVFDDGFEERIQQHLAATGSRQFEVSYTAERGGNVNVNEDIRMVSNSALANGKVDVEGQGEAGKEKRSTSDHPEIRQRKYDADDQTEAQALRDLARD
ncbi:MAG: DUF4747 family protein [Erythrobacter sp.]